MNASLLRCLRASLNIPRIYSPASLYHFSKKKMTSPQNNHQSHKQDSLRKSIIQPQQPVEAKEEPQTKDIFADDDNIRKLIVLNVLLAGATPFWASANAGVVILNSGFILSQVGREIKTYLLLVNSDHYEQIAGSKRPQQHLKTILNNFLFLSVNCIFLSFGLYTSTHLGILAWYLFSIVAELLPFHYWIMVFPIMTVIIFNEFSTPMLKTLFPSEIEIVQSIQPRK